MAKTKYSMNMILENGKDIPIALFDDEINTFALRKIGQCAFDNIPLYKRGYIVDMDTGEIVWNDERGQDWDFLFEGAPDTDYEREQLLVETDTLEHAWQILEKWEWTRDELVFRARLTVEEGEELGLDTY